ncbi:hypothetical protein D3C87_1959460 [compost metagenome]
MTAVVPGAGLGLKAVTTKFTIAKARIATIRPMIEYISVFFALVTALASPFDVA